MSRRDLFKTLPLAALLALPAAPALAGGGTDRYVWRHSGGFFENSNGNSWTEKAGKHQYHFQEVKRTPDAVILYDASRDCYVLLNCTGCHVKFGHDHYKLFYHGKWD